MKNEPNEVTKPLTVMLSLTILPPCPPPESLPVRSAEDRKADRDGFRLLWQSAAVRMPFIPPSCSFQPRPAIISINQKDSGNFRSFLHFCIYFLYK